MNKILKTIVTNVWVQAFSGIAGFYLIFSNTDFSRAYPDIKIPITLVLVIIRCAYERKKRFSHVNTAIISFTMGLSAMSLSANPMVFFVVFTLGTWVMVSFDGKPETESATASS